ncbi:MAG: hypothetical protein WA399_05565 [Acidobacteriaceae bacterium]
MQFRIGNSLFVLALFLMPVLYAQDRLIDDASEPSITGVPAGSAIVVAAPPQAVHNSLPGMTFTDWSLLGAAGVFRYLDYQTTVKALDEPTVFHEVELPQALVDNHPAFAAFEVSTVVANYWVYRLLVRHGHRRLARAGQVINLGAIGGTVTFNEYNLAEYYLSRH